jgi:hypothetical protein
MPDDLPFVPDATLDLVDPGWWLELRCGCGRSTYVPHKLLVRAHGRSAWVPHLLSRMRCQQCRRRPILAQWVDRTDGGPPHYPEPKRVPLALAWQKGPGAIN